MGNKVQNKEDDLIVVNVVSADFKKSSAKCK
jgi:hypothetical protein